MNAREESLICRSDSSEAVAETAATAWVGDGTVGVVAQWLKRMAQHISDH